MYERTILLVPHFTFAAVDAITVGAARGDY